MKTQGVTAIFSLIISAISIISVLWLYPYGVGYDISISVFSGSLFAVAIAFVSFCAERQQRIQMILFRTRNIKVLSNGFLNVKTKEEFIHICRDIESEYDIAQMAAADIQACGQIASREVDSLWKSTGLYVSEMLIELEKVEYDSSNDYTEPLSQITSTTMKKLNAIIQAWVPLAKKYISTPLYNSYCDLDEIQLGKETHKTIREIWEEYANGQAKI